MGARLKLCAMFGLGLAVMFVLIQIIGFLPALSPHGQILAGIGVFEYGVQDPTNKVQLSGRCVQSATAVYGAGAPLSFTGGKSYQISTWVFSRADDAELVLTVWGPGDDGYHYDIECARLTGYEVDVFWKGAIQLHFNSLMGSNPQNQALLGFGWFSVTP